MGVKGLESYLNNNPGNYYRNHQLHNTDLVIDGLTITYHLFESVRTSHELGAKYDYYGEIIHNFFDDLGRCNVNPIVVMDSGILKSGEKSIEKEKAKLRRKEKKKQGLYLVRQVFMRIVRLKGIKMVQVMGDAAATIAAIAGYYNCPVLTRNGDYFLRGRKVIPLPNFTGNVRSSRTGETLNCWMVCKLFRFDIFLKDIRMFDKRHLLPLALLILGHRGDTPFLPSEVLIPLFSRLQDHYKSRNIQVSHNRIENTLKWLADCSSMNEAVGELLSCFDKDHRRKILAIVEENMKEINTPSLQALYTLRFPEEVIQRAVKKPFKFTGDVDQLETRILMKVNSKKYEDAREIEEKETVKWYEEKFIQLLPHWIINDYSSGAISTTLMKLCIRPRKKLVEQEVEDYNYPPAGMISIPIIKAIYSLVLTLQKDEEGDLKFHIIRCRQIQVEMERVVKASINLKKMKNISGVVRRRFIDDVLGTDGDKLEELPREWRLYVAAVMYWMKQEEPPLKTEAHLYSVLFAMLIGIIDKKIGFVRSKHLYDERFGAMDPETLRNRGSAREDVSLQDLVQKVSITECILALPFFLEHIPEDQAATDGRPEDWKTVVHTFNQLHSCLKSVIELNEILNYVYVQISLPEVFNGTLFYGLFEAFSKQADVDSYLSAKLEYSPNIVEIFRKLRDLVVAEL